MKNPFETLIIPGGILLLGFLSALLLPAPSFGLIWAQRILPVVFAAWHAGVFCYPFYLASLVSDALTPLSNASPVKIRITEM